MRAIYHVSLLCLSLASSVAYAGPPTITAPEKAYGEVGDWVEIKVETTGKWVRYVPMDAGLKSFPNDRLKDSRSTWVSATVPGYYRVIAYTGNDEGGAETIVWVKFGQSGVIPIPPGPSPNPTPPTPNPVPPNPIPVPPVPVPVIVEAWVIVVEETSERTPAIALVLNDKKFWDSLPLLGWRFYDKDSPDAKRHKYDQLANQEIEKTKANTSADDPPRKLPLIMVLDGQGKLIRSKNLPTDTAAIREFIRQSTGR